MKALTPYYPERCYKFDIIFVLVLSNAFILFLWKRKGSLRTGKIKRYRIYYRALRWLVKKRQECINRGIGISSYDTNCHSPSDRVVIEIQHVVSDLRTFNFDRQKYLQYCILNYSSMYTCQGYRLSMTNKKGGRRFIISGMKECWVVTNSNSYPEKEPILILYSHTEFAPGVVRLYRQ